MMAQSLTIGFIEIRLAPSGKHSISQISFRRCLNLEIKPNPFSDAVKSSHDQIKYLKIVWPSWTYSAITIARCYKNSTEEVYHQC